MVYTVIRIQKIQKSRLFSELFLIYRLNLCKKLFYFQVILKNILKNTYFLDHYYRKNYENWINLSD